MATREQIYVSQLIALGVWQPAFLPAVKTLADMEREHQRVKKAWRARGSDVTSDLYAVIVQHRRDIFAHRDALGLTPKGLRRLKAASIVPESSGTEAVQGASPAVTSLLANLREQAAANSQVSNTDTPPEADAP